MKYFFAFLLVFILKFNLSANEDSLYIEKMFQKSFSSVDSSEFYKEQAHKRYLQNSDEFSLYFAYHFNLGKYLMRNGQPEGIIEIARDGIVKSAKNKSDIASGNFYNLMGSAYSIKNETDSAIFYFQKSLSKFETAGDSIRAAYINNNIGNIFFSLLEFETAYDYINASYQTIKNDEGNPEILSIKAVLGIAESKTNRIELAEKHLSEVMKKIKETPNLKAEIIALYGMGEIYYIKEKYDSSIVHFKQSLELSQKVNYQMYIMLNAIGLMNTFNDSKNHQEAIDYGFKALQISKQTNNQNTLYAIHKNLAYAYNGINQSDSAYFHLNLAHDLFKTLSKEENKKIINDILLKYDTKKKENQLAESRNQVLEKEIQLEQRLFWITFLIFSLLTLIILAFFSRFVYLQRIQKLKIKQKQAAIESFIKGEEKERERMAHELHDGISAELLGIRLKAENLHNESSLPKDLKNAHEEIRRVAHNLAPLKLETSGLSGALKHFCTENSHPKLKVNFFNELKNDLQINYLTKVMLYRIAQELIQNAIKHALPNEIDVQIIGNEKEIMLSVEDNGKGFDLKSIKGKDHFIHTIQSRLQVINGTLEVDSTPQQGTSCFVKVRLA